jgi:hypothetical protein
MAAAQDLQIDQLNILCKPLFELAQQMADYAGKIMRDRLLAMHQELSQSLDSTKGILVCQFHLSLRGRHKVKLAFS